MHFSGSAKLLDNVKKKHSNQKYFGPYSCASTESRLAVMVFGYF
jgi:hypothetical protein